MSSQDLEEAGEGVVVMVGTVIHVVVMVGVAMVAIMDAVVVAAAIMDMVVVAKGEEVYQIVLPKNCTKKVL